MTDKFRREMNEFFDNEDIRGAVETEDIGFIYHEFESKYIYTQPLTMFFRELDFDPLNYIKLVYCGMYIREPLPETFVIPEGITAIKTLAFHQCKTLGTIYIPKSVKVISREAFSDCGNLHTVIYGGTQDDWLNIHMAKDAFHGVKLTTIQCSDGLFEV